MTFALIPQETQPKATTFEPETTEPQDIVDAPIESVEQKFEAKQPMVLCDPVELDDLTEDFSDGKHGKRAMGLLPGCI